MFEREIPLEKDKAIEQSYLLAKELYREYGTDTDAAIDRLAGIPISLHCWQGDDVGGFENPDADLGGGLAVTGNYPGKARTAEELRADADKAFDLIPGTHRFNLHAIYAETGGKKVPRNELAPEHFAAWIDWARSRNMGLDFNPTFFSHPKADSGFTLSSHDEGIRRLGPGYADGYQYLDSRRLQGYSRRSPGPATDTAKVAG